MADPVAIEPAWLAAHPLPDLAASADKDDRGHVVVIGGSRQVPGGLRLTGESALRAGAGRLQLVTLECLAVALGMAIPEAGVLALPENADGELHWDPTESIAEALRCCDSLVIGPALTTAGSADPIVDAALDDAREGLAVVLDAVAIEAVPKLKAKIARFEGRAVLTPNRGEMAKLLEVDIAAVARDAEGTIRRAVELTGASVILKGPRSLVATPQGDLLRYEGGGIGLATGGSGDVLAGILGGLLARGAQVRDACAWAVWLHGEAGRSLAKATGPIGYLARELPPLVPPLMRV